MYQNYIFDLYGTLADTHTNEGKHYLWNKLSAFFSSYGALYTPAELKKAYWKYVRDEETKYEDKFVEIRLDTVFARPSLPPFPQARIKFANSPLPPLRMGKRCMIVSRSSPPAFPVSWKALRP